MYRFLCGPLDCGGTGMNKRADHASRELLVYDEGVKYVPSPMSFNYHTDFLELFSKLDRWVMVVICFKLCSIQ